MRSSFCLACSSSAQADGPLSALSGGTIALAIGQSALSTQLTTNFAKYAPDAPLAVIEQSPLEIHALEPAVRAQAIVAYVKSLDIGASPFLSFSLSARPQSTTDSPLSSSQSLSSASPSTRSASLRRSSSTMSRSRRSRPTRTSSARATRSRPRRTTRRRARPGGAARARRRARRRGRSTSRRALPTASSHGPRALSPSLCAPSFSLLHT